MNKHTYTFLTLFLLISSLFGNPVRGAETDLRASLQLISEGTILDNGDYYVITNGDSRLFYLTYKTVSINGKVYTTSKATQDHPTAETLNAYLWQIKDAKLDNTIVGCYLINKATGDTLTFDNDGAQLKDGATLPLRNLLCFSGDVVVNNTVVKNMNTYKPTLNIAGLLKDIWPTEMYAGAGGSIMNSAVIYTLNT
ncbi:MAG: hypothetical protein SPJ02_10865, partial [Parabacteroides sp.]|nr:hypothetical protein [Parabacteroides sp.]